MKQQAHYRHRFSAQFSLGLILSGLSLAAVAAHAADIIRLDATVVTASGWQEPVERVSSTIHAISAEHIQRSRASSLTELPGEHAVGFFSEWTPAQISVNIRGGSSDGQGRDFRGQVLVLLNGRHAGTPNLSKLSLADVERIEVVRGPGSVAYGSQGMGGVVNRITATAGSYDMLGAHGFITGQLGDTDHYLGLAGARSSSYRSGSGSPERMANTAWERWSGLGSLGWELDVGRAELTIRRDGVYDVGFRGSSWDIDNYDDRYNGSVDLSFSTRLSNLDYSVHGCVIKDDDEFFWGPHIGRR